MITPKEMTRKIYEKWCTRDIRVKVHSMAGTYEMIKAIAGNKAKDYDQDGFIGEVQELIKEADSYKN